MGFIRRPHYYKDFTCIASACTDSCCQGWEIDIDDETLAFYQQVDGAFGKRLAENIALPDASDYEPAHFIQCEGERCPFLNERNLCDIILTIGEEHISQICTHHPRFYDWFLGGEEAGLGLCCEEAARLMLQPHNGPAFDVLHTDDADDTDASAWEADDDLLFELEIENMLFSMRETLFSELSLSVGPDKSPAAAIDERFSRLYTLADRMQAEYDEKMFPDPDADPVEPRECDWSLLFWQRDFLEGFLDFLLNLEINDASWYRLLHQVKEQLPALFSARDGFLEYYRDHLYEYENLLAYFVFRYFMKARGDSAVSDKICFALLSVSMIELLDIREWMLTGTLTERQQINICKLYSKEIEYDEDNMEQVSMYLNAEE